MPNKDLELSSQCAVWAMGVTDGSPRQISMVNVKTRFLRLRIDGVINLSINRGRYYKVVCLPRSVSTLESEVMEDLEQVIKQAMCLYEESL